MSLEASYSTTLNVFLLCLAAILRSAVSSFYLSTLDSTLRACADSRSTEPVATASVDDMLRCAPTWIVWSSLLTSGAALARRAPLACAYLSAHFSTKLRILSLRAALATTEAADRSSSVSSLAAVASGDSAAVSSSPALVVEAGVRQPAEYSETTVAIFGSSALFSVSIVPAGGGPAAG